jgi:CHASE3 domain sensor protein
MELATKPESKQPVRFSRRQMRPLSLIVGVLLVVGIGVLTFHTEAGVDYSRKWVVHTYDVRTDLQNLEMAITQARAARSTYLLSGDPEQFAQLKHQLQNIPQLLERLRNSTADNPRQQERIKSLEPLLTEQIADMGNVSPVAADHKSIPTDGGSYTRQIIDRQEQIDILIRDMS